MKDILSATESLDGLQRMAGAILAGRGGAAHLALVGIRRGGVPIAEHLARIIERESGISIPIGSVDITLYRDDGPVPLPVARIGRSEVNFDVTSRRIVLVDDVLFTGRTVRAALHALLDYGRARAIELAVLIDRGGRELPIQPDYVVKNVEASPTTRVDVVQDESGFRAVVVETE